MNEPIRTVASAPSVCAVCETNRRIRIVAISGWRVTAFMPCPHCSIRDAVEIRHYPTRTDKPRGLLA